MEAEYWAYHYTDNRVDFEVEDEDFDADEILAALEASDGDWERLIDDH